MAWAEFLRSLLFDARAAEASTEHRKSPRPGLSPRQTRMKGEKKTRGVSTKRKKEDKERKMKTTREAIEGKKDEETRKKKNF